MAGTCNPHPLAFATAAIQATRIKVRSAAYIFSRAPVAAPLLYSANKWPMTQAAAASRVVAARWRQSSLSNLSGLGQEPFAHSSGYRLGLHICLGFLVGLVYRGRALRAHCNCPRGNRSRIKGHGQLDGRAWLLCAKYTCLV